MSRSKEALRELARRELILRKCREHPANFLQYVSMPDEREGGKFQFAFDEEGWGWQREVLDWWIDHQRTVVLKARQLGITWLGAGMQLWRCLFYPGSLCLVYRQKEKDSSIILERQWDMLHSVPEWMWNGARIISPTRGARPNTEIKFQFPDGSISTIRGMASAQSAGHGETASDVLMDEFAYNEYAAECLKAANSAAGRTGKVRIVSTANGRADDEGEGNYFYHIYNKSPGNGFQSLFLPWYKHPDRDEDWYENDPEVRALRWFEKKEQYPNTPADAFTLSSKVFFDQDALDWYSNNAVAKGLYRFDFKRTAPNKARILKSSEGLTEVFVPPSPEHSYAIGADVATGRGQDYSAAYVIDLSNMALCAELHGKIGADQFAYQLHYLGKWYNAARLAVEMGGGYGEPVVISLRDGKDGRPGYPALFRYREDDRVDPKERASYGFPINTKTRPLLVNNLERVIRERALPWMTSSLLFECGDFVTHDNLPSPRAAKGMHDDRVMAAALTLEMFRRYGHHPTKPRQRTRRTYKPWLALGNK